MKTINTLASVRGVEIPQTWDEMREHFPYLDDYYGSYMDDDEGFPSDTQIIDALKRYLGHVSDLHAEKRNEVFAEVSSYVITDQGYVFLSTEHAS